MHRGKLSVVSCKSGRPFAVKVCRALAGALTERGSPAALLVPATERWFPNGEVKVVINRNIRGDDVYVIQNIANPLSSRSINDNLLALLVALDAARQSDAEHITAVIPYFPYSRQERKKGREAISAALVARFLEDAGVERVITMDIHAEAIAGFFRSAVLEDLHASRSIIPAFLDLYGRDPADRLAVVSPDTGSANRARHFSQKLGCALAICDKERDPVTGKVRSTRLVGDVRGRDVLIVDDMIDEGSSIVAAVEEVRRGGADHVYLACTFPFFNGPAIGRLEGLFWGGKIRCVMGTDALSRGKRFVSSHPWYREVSVAPLFAQVIFLINTKQSVSELLK